MELYGKYFDPGTAGRPYGGEGEYWSDLLAVLDMRLAVLAAWRAGNPDLEEMVDWRCVREMALPPERVVALLKRGRLVAASGGQGGRAGAVREQILMGTRHIACRLTQTAGMGGGFALRRLFRIFSLNSLEQFVFLVGAAPRMDARYEGIYLDIQGGGRADPTLRLAFSLYELSEEISEEEKASLGQGRGRLFEFLCDLKGGEEADFSRTYQASGRLWSYLCGERRMPESLERIANLKPLEEDPGPALIREGEIRRICRFLEEYGDAQPGRGRVLHLYGEAGNGRRFALQKGAAQAGKAVIFVEVAPLLGKGADFDALLRRLKLECVLADAVLCFVETGIREDEEEETEQAGGVRRFPEDLDLLLKTLSRKLGTFVWMSLERAGYLTRYPLHFLAIEFPMLSIGERLVLWRAFGKDFPLGEGTDPALFANQYILTAKGIRESLLRADMMRSGEGEAVISRECLKRAVKQQSVNQLGRYATLINAVFDWEDLVIDGEQRRQMQMICDQVRYRNVVGEEWGFHKKTPYGRGICALLYGSPGTGKTMAVQVMANELGLDLYRIDLSQMVSKYIGETEKNISALFRKARNLNAVLFFDEADSMFAKRSEVKDSNDRNANAETAHLLQKLEDYGGITFLATNYVNNIDDAFKRRIKFMIHFVFPTKEVRLRLWRQILPPQARLEEELDLEFFAGNFELAGSNIKEVLTNAAYMAAAEHRGMANRDIVEAVRLNFSKYGKVLTRDDFGYLGQ